MPVYSGISKEKYFENKIFLSVVQFQYGTLRFCELGLRGDGHWLSEPTTCFRIIGKEICVSQNRSDNDAKKNRLQDFYNIFICMCRRQYDQNW